jgi:hypothetical protein
MDGGNRLVVLWKAGPWAIMANSLAVPAPVRTLRSIQLKNHVR